MTSRIGKRSASFLAVLLIAAVALVLLQRSGPREPGFQGKSLTSWITQSESTAERTIALRAMEKEGIPFLTRQLSRQPSPITLGLRRLSSSFPKWVPPEALYADRRATAAYGLGLMGPPAATAVVALESLKETTSEEYLRRTATFALMRIRQEPLPPCIDKLNDTAAADWYENVTLIKLFGCEASAAIPTLIQTLETTNRIDSLILAHICEALGRIHRRPEVCVPALVPFLKSPDLTLRQQAVLALKQFGPAAQPARAALLECLKDPDPWIVTNSAWILEQIDSNPAARSGSN